MKRNAQDIIDDMRNIVKPRIAKMLLETNFEGCGKEDKAEFETEFEMILTLAEKTLEQEPTTKNCESCRHYGLHHEICNYCYKCSLWKEKEPTTKKCITCAYRKIDGKPHEMCKSCVCGNRYREDSTTKNDCAEQNGCITCSLDDGDDCCRKLYEESMQESSIKNDLADDKTFYEQIVEYCNEHFLVLVEKDVWEDAEKALTTKNDLRVDCISRDSAIKALDYDIKCFEFKLGVSKHMDDIAKLLNTIYETQVNNIKDLPSVTPQEPGLDKIRAEIEEYQKDAFYSDDVMMPKKMVLAIIDKYKTESEGDNGT